MINFKKIKKKKHDFRRPKVEEEKKCSRKKKNRNFSKTMKEGLLVSKRRRRLRLPLSKLCLGQLLILLSEIA